MLPVVFENLLVGAVGLLLLLYLGWGLSRWLPAAILPYRWLVVPWVGYSLLVIVTQFLTNLPPALTSLQSAYVALVLATAVNAYALFRDRRAPRIRPARIDRRLLTLIGLVGLVVFVLGVLPLWSYGYTTIIGENWDAEIYTGLGEYLRFYPQAHLTSALPNPVLDTLINPPYSLRTHGFSYFQAALGFLPLDSLRTLAPLLALVRALSIPASFVFFALTMRLRPAPALTSCVALGLNAFLLWITFNTFGMQVPTFGLLPLAVCAIVLTADRAVSPGASRALVSPALWAGLFAAAIAVTYHPALTALIAMVGPVLAVLFFLHLRDRLAWRLVLSGALIAATGVVLSAVSQVKSIDGFLKQYSEKTAGLGLTGFTLPSDAFGFSLSFRDLLGPTAGRPLVALASRLYSVDSWLAFAIAACLVILYIYALWSDRGGRENAWQQSALLAGAVVYALLFIRPLDYPYGWFKALSFISFPLVGAAVGGLFLLGSRLIRVPRGEPGGNGAGGVLQEPLSAGLRSVTPMLVGLVLLVPVLLTTALVVGMYWGQPLRFDREMLDVGAVRDIVMAAPAPNRSVYISDSPNMRLMGRLYYGLLSYYLRDTDLYGKFDTANSSLNRTRSDGLYDFSLLHADDSPEEYGVANARLAWHNPIASLYVSPPAGSRLDLFHHNFRDDGKYPSLAAAKPLTLTVDSGNVRIGGASGSTQTPLTGPLQLSLGVAGFTTSTLQVDMPGGSADVTVPPGYTVYRSPGLGAPGPVRLSTTGDGGMYLRWDHLEKFRQAPGQEPGLTAGGAGLLAEVSSRKEGEQIGVDISYLNNRPEAVSQTLSLDIYGAGRDNSEHYGYWNFVMPPGRPTQLSLALDPARKQITNQGAGALQPSSSFAGPTGDGRYTASLLVYENGQVSETFNDVFAFQIKDGRLASFEPRNLPPQFR